jgi:hypothetical protein
VLHVYWVMLRNQRPEIGSIKLVLDMNTLDKDQALPNIGNHLRRGIWWPNMPAPTE